MKSGGGVFDTYDVIETPRAIDILRLPGPDTARQIIWQSDKSAERGDQFAKIAGGGIHNE